MTEVSKKVMEQLLDLSAGSEDVEAGLSDLLVKEDLNKKVTALASCYKKWLKLRGEIKKAERPDQVQVDKDGKPVSSAFSKKAFEALKVLREKAGKIERAVEKALKEEDYGDVYNIAQSKDDGGSKSEEASDTDAS
jgi:hypothetical protein